MIFQNSFFFFFLVWFVTINLIAFLIFLKSFVFIKLLGWATASWAGLGGLIGGDGGSKVLEQRGPTVKMKKYRVNYVFDSYPIYRILIWSLTF